LIRSPDGSVSLRVYWTNNSIVGRTKIGRNRRGIPPSNDAILVDVEFHGCAAEPIEICVDAKITGRHNIDGRAQAFDEFVCGDPDPVLAGGQSEADRKDEYTAEDPPHCPLLFGGTASAATGITRITAGGSADWGSGPLSYDSLLIDEEAELASAHWVSINKDAVIAGVLDSLRRAAHLLRQLSGRDAGPRVASRQSDATQEQSQDPLH
jgi:hypothetical protein